MKMPGRKIERAKNFLLFDSKLMINSWEENDEGKWFSHIHDRMFRDEIKEFKEIIGLIKEAVDELYIKYFSTVPLYTEHYMTHSRNVINILLRFLELIPNEVDEEDVLYMTVAGLLHDLGQYDPLMPHHPRSDPKETEKALADIFDSVNEILRSKNHEEKYRFLFESDSIFRKKAFLLALYHQKNMPFDEEYREKYRKIKNRQLDNETLYNRLDREKIFSGDKGMKEHFLGLAALFKLADGLDVQKYRETTEYSVITRITSVIKESKRYLLSNNESEFKNSAVQISHLIKDMLISKIMIKRVNEKENRVAVILCEDKSKKEAKYILEMIKENIIPKIYYELADCRDAIYKTIIGYLAYQNEEFVKKLKNMLNASGCDSINAEINEDEYLKSLITNYVKKPLSEEFYLTKDYIEKYLGLKIEKISIRKC